MDYETLTALLDDEAGAIKPGPGKFEGNPDLRVAEGLYELTLDGALDAEAGVVDEGGWFGRIGQFVVEEDSFGFFTYSVFGDEQEATDNFHRWVEDE